MRVHSLCASLLSVLLTGGCSGSGTQRAALPAVDATIRDRMAQTGAFAWRDSRPLTWADFRGVPPADGSEGAQTRYNLLFGVGCTGSLFRFDVIAAFEPAASWVRPAVLADPEGRSRTLRHEQTHFNITEVFARRLRRFFSSVYDPCGPTLDDTRTSAERYVSSEAETQQRYDEDTRNGRDAARQTTWDGDVTGWLDELSAYRGGQR